MWNWYRRRLAGSTARRSEGKLHATRDRSAPLRSRWRLLADLTNHSRQSLVVGYDRVPSEASITIELGARSFLSSFATPDFIPWKSVPTPLDLGNELPVLNRLPDDRRLRVLGGGEVALLGLARDFGVDCARHPILRGRRHPGLESAWFPEQHRTAVSSAGRPPTVMAARAARHGKYSCHFVHIW